MKNTNKENIPQKPRKGYSLQDRMPSLCKQWHPTKNGSLTPKDISIGNDSHQIWWLCKKKHTWNQTVHRRVKAYNREDQCRYCSGQVASKNNNLAVIVPELAREWHPKKNKHLKSPENYSCAAGTKAWWLCDNGHEWEAPIYSRTKKNTDGKFIKRGGCPKCPVYLTEEIIRSFCTMIFPDVYKHYEKQKLRHNDKIFEHELDIFIPSKQIAVEVDGYRHEERYSQDRNKNESACNEGISIIRYRMEPLEKIDQELDYKAPRAINSNDAKDFMIHVIKKLKVFNTLTQDELSVLKNIEKNSEELYKEFEAKARANKMCGKRSFKDEFPEKAKYWNTSKNSPLLVEHITSHSGIKRWWFCDHGHEWKATVASVTASNVLPPCPYCSGKKVDHTNNISVTEPGIFQEWNYEKNASIDPYKLTKGSSKKVWWTCKKGHDWLTSLNNRSTHKQGCPTCSGRNFHKGRSLVKTHPQVAKLWHPTKNGTLTAKDVSAGLNQKAWWICINKHEYEQLINGKSINCPICTGKRVHLSNCLQRINPRLANEWHHKKNINLSPYDVTSKSGKKVWWLCKKKHEWESVISCRSSGNNCPYCSGRLASSDNNLLSIYPNIAKEWHPTKNGELKPNMVTPSSHKKVWWKSKNGHEWQAFIYNRTGSLSRAARR